MEFNYSIEESFNIIVVHLSGDLIDKNQTVRMTEEVEGFISQGKSKLILDMEELRYMNSSGLNALITLLTKSRKTGGEAVITNVSKKIKELFLITKLNTVFTVTDSMEKAVSKLK